MWHWRWIQLIRSSLNLPPDFRGRWEGSYKRENEYLSHKFVVEIKQTLSKISVYTYSSKKSESQSYIAEIATDDSEENFTLCYLWQGEGTEIAHLNIPKGIFDGYSMLNLKEKEVPRKLCGPYFTNRDPQTKGKIELNWVSYQLKNRFE